MVWNNKNIVKETKVDNTTSDGTGKDITNEIEVDKDEVKLFSIEELVPSGTPITIPYMEAYRTNELEYIPYMSPYNVGIQSSSEDSSDSGSSDVNSDVSSSDVGDDSNSSSSSSNSSSSQPKATKSLQARDNKKNGYYNGQLYENGKIVLNSSYINTLSKQQALAKSRQTGTYTSSTIYKLKKRAQGVRV